MRAPGPREWEAVITGDARFSVTCGDALHLLEEMPDNCVDTCITDPPYSSGGQFRGDRAQSTEDKYVKTGSKHVPEDFAGDTRDQRAYQLWVAFWSSSVLRVVKEGGVLCCFCDWRQLAATEDALQAGGWVLRGIVPWDKTEGTRPRLGGFRAQCEYILWCSKGPLLEQPVCLPGCLRFSVGQNKLHQAVKPDALMNQLIRIVPPGAPPEIPSGIVLDPFGGSGSTCKAAIQNGRRAIVFDIMQSWCDVVLERALAERDISTLAARAAGQTALFAAEASPVKD